MLLTTAALCMALNIYHEARGEPVLGQYAVAYVTLNRAESDKEKICDVVLARKQFSWTTKLVKGKKLLKSGEPIDEDAWKKAQIIASVTLSGRMMDITKGSTHYHAKRVNPYWSKTMPVMAVMGQHIFYKYSKSVMTKEQKWNRMA